MYDQYRHTFCAFYPIFIINRYGNDVSDEPSIDDSVAAMSTARGSALEIWFSDCCLYYFGSRIYVAS